MTPAPKVHTMSSLSLQVKQIRPSSHSSNCLVLLNDLTVVLHADSVAVLKLSAGGLLDEKGLSSLLTRSVFDLLLDYSLKLIAASPQSPKLLALRLARRRNVICQKYRYPLRLIDQSVVSQVQDHLSRRQLLNPQDFITAFIRRHRLKSPVFIASRLSQLGFTPSQFRPYLPGQDQQADTLKKIILKQITSPSQLRQVSIANRLKSRLYRRGFSLQQINNAIDDIRLSG